MVVEDGGPSENRFLIARAEGQPRQSDWIEGDPQQRSRSSPSIPFLVSMGRDRALTVGGTACWLIRFAHWDRMVAQRRMQGGISLSYGPIGAMMTIVATLVALGIVILLGAVIGADFKQLRRNRAA